jgi:hypothetical protein
VPVRVGGHEIRGDGPVVEGRMTRACAVRHDSRPSVDGPFVYRHVAGRIHNVPMGPRVRSLTAPVICVRYGEWDRGPAIARRARRACRGVH